MTNSKQAHLDSIQSIKSEFLAVLEGMAYCLDWKQDESEWSARELVYHMLDSPPGGAQNLVKGIISGDVQEYEIWSDLTNITPERAAFDIGQVNADITTFFGSLSNSISGLTDGDLDQKKATMYQRTRGSEEERTLNAILERTLNGHIKEHLVQLRTIREALAI